VHTVKITLPYTKLQQKQAVE